MRAPVGCASSGAAPARAAAAGGLCGGGEDGRLAARGAHGCLWSLSLPPSPLSFLPAVRCASACWALHSPGPGCSRPCTPCCTPARLCWCRARRQSWQSSSTVHPLLCWPSLSIPRQSLLSRWQLLRLVLPSGAPPSSPDRHQWGQPLQHPALQPRPHWQRRAWQSARSRRSSSCRPCWRSRALVPRSSPSLARQGPQKGGARP